MHPPAEAALLEFGGLHVRPASISGRDQATADIHLDPESWYERDRFEDAEQFYVHRPLFPLGEASREHLWLGIDDLGRVFASFDWEFVYFKGDTTDQAVIALLEGHKLGDVPRSTAPYLANLS